MNTPENKQGKESIFVESLKRPNWWLVILVIILTIAFYLLDIQASWDSSVLTLLLNIVFVVVPAFFIAVISSRGFLQSGSRQIMWLGVGTLTYGLAVLLSFWLRTWASANAQITTFAIVYLLAGLFFFIGSLLALNKASIKAYSSSQGRLTNLLVIYFIVVALISLTTFVSVSELLPPFFIQGEGSTGLRITLQVIALLLFLVSGLLIITNYLKSKTPFLLWYGLGLILTVVNTAGNLVLTSFGTPLNWALRGAQLLAGVYLLMAAVTIVREARAKRLPTGEALARLLSTTEATLREKEAALKVSEERYRLAVAATDDAIWDIDLNTGSVYWNETYTAKFGRPPETSSSWQWWIDHIHPEEREQVASSLRNAIDSLEKSWVREYRFQRTDGLWANIYDRAYIARDESGKAWRVVGAMQDITERKKAEEQVAAAHRQTQSIIDNTSSIVYAFDLEERFIMANTTLAKLFNTTLEQMIGKRRHDFMPKADADWHEANDRQAIKTGRALEFEEYSQLPGHSITWLTTKFPLHDAQGRVYAVAGISSDISERKKVEEALKEREKEYKSLAENIPDIVTRYDRDLRHIFVNTAASKAAGIQPEDFIGKTNLELGQNTEQVEFWMKHVRNVFASGKPETMEFEWMAPDGLRYQQTIITPEFDIDGSVKTVLCVTHNFTEIKKAEKELKHYNAELEAANKELESYSYSISHDLRTPLRTLDGFSEMVITEYGDKLDETGKNYLNRIRKASQTMSQLTEDILKLSRITRAEMHKGKVNLSEMTASIANELKASQPERQAEFIIAPDIIVNGDKALLEILLRNLLENSWKYTGKCPDTRIETGVNRQDGKMVYFIKDNGIGFEMKYYDKLFQPFQRLHTSKDYPGTGIGLATAARVIHRHSGKIWAESEIGKGTTFYFTLE